MKTIPYTKELFHYISGIVQCVVLAGICHQLVWAEVADLNSRTQTWGRGEREAHATGGDEGDSQKWPSLIHRHSPTAPAYEARIIQDKTLHLCHPFLLKCISITTKAGWEALGTYENSLLAIGIIHCSQFIPGSQTCIQQWYRMNISDLPTALSPSRESFAI